MQKKHIYLLLIIWTFCVLVILGVKYYSFDNNYKNDIKAIAQMIYKKDVTYRKWLANHGGVYVPISNHTPPNKYLDFIEKRDVTTNYGQKLTLVNPAYMTRQIFEGNNGFAYAGHLSSLKPLNPKNKPTLWEEKVLQRFETGDLSPEETFTTKDGKSYFSFMQVFCIEKSCLKCHAQQDYKLGDIRGGLSVSIPKKDILVFYRKNFNISIIILFMIWILGDIIIILFGRKMISIFEDLRISKNNEISEQEKKMLNSELTWKQIFDASLDMIAIIDKDFTIQRANRTMKEKFGNDIIGEKCHDLVHGKKECIGGCFAENVFKTGEECSGAICESFLNDMWVDIEVMPIKNNQGEVEQVIHIFKDITKEKKIELEKIEIQKDLVEARKKAESANIAKSQFLANMSHEIRTPMNGIIGVSEVLDDIVTKPETKKMTSLIKNSSKHLLSLLNDIIDYSKIEAGKLKINIEEINLKEEIEHNVELFAVTLTDKDVELSSNYNSDMTSFKGDIVRITQCLNNIIGNAVKFTKKGSIIITTNISRKDANIADITISIQDTGIGIKKENINKIFEYFTQEDESITKKYGGAGLGITITKQLAQLMGGDLNVISEYGQGSIFTLSLQLPFIKNISKKNKEKTGISLLDRIHKTKILKALIVDDNKSNLLTLEIMLSPYRYEIDKVENGTDAIKKFKKNHYNLIFMDCMMPKMDGYETTCELRKLEKDNHLEKTPVIAVTGKTSNLDKEKCFDIGMTDYIKKPITKSNLENVMNKYLSTQTTMPKDKTNSKNNKYSYLKNFIIDNNQYEKYRSFSSNVVDSIKIAIEQIRKDFNDLENAINQNDLDIIENSAHSLKSTFNNLGMLDMAKVAEELEKKFDKKEKLKPVLKDLSKNVSDIIAFLNN